MNYFNVRSGLRKLFLSQDLQLAASVIMILGLIYRNIVTFLPYQAAAAAIGLIRGELVTLILAGLLELGGFLVAAVGVLRSSRDQSDFRQAAKWLMLAAAVAIPQCVLPFFGDETLSDTMDLLSDVFELVSIFCIIRGIIALADRAGRPKVIESARRIRSRTLIVYGAGVLLAAAAVTLELSRGESSFDSWFTLPDALGLAAEACSIVAYCIYFGLLLKVKKMLEEMLNAPAKD